MDEEQVYLHDLSYLTDEQLTWTNDFCRWWFSFRLEDIGYEGDFHLRPHLWKRAERERVYVFLRGWEPKTKHVLKLGYFSKSREGMFIVNSVYSQLDQLHKVLPMIERDRDSLINIAKYGIEGCVLRHEEVPVKEWIQHVLNTMTVKMSDIVEIQWPNFHRPIDGRTQTVLETQVLRDVLKELHLGILVCSSGYAEVEALDNRGTEWLVIRSDSKKDIEIKH